MASKPPFHLRLDSVLKPEVLAELAKAGKVVFRITGNTGNPKTQATEFLVADQMTKVFDTKGDKPAFLYVLENSSCLAGLDTLNRASRPARRSLGEVGRDDLIIGRRFSAGYCRFQIGPVPEGRGEPPGLEMIRITSLAWIVHKF
jgi:hypothetical protein